MFLESVELLYSRENVNEFVKSFAETVKLNEDLHVVKVELLALFSLNEFSYSLFSQVVLFLVNVVQLNAFRHFLDKHLWVFIP